MNKEEKKLLRRIGMLALSVVLVLTNMGGPLTTVFASELPDTDTSSIPIQDVFGSEECEIGQVKVDSSGYSIFFIDNNELVNAYDSARTEENFMDSLAKLEENFGRTYVDAVEFTFEDERRSISAALYQSAIDAMAGSSKENYFSVKESLDYDGQVLEFKLHEPRAFEDESASELNYDVDIIPFSSEEEASVRIKTSENYTDYSKISDSLDICFNATNKDWTYQMMECLGLKNAEVLVFDEEGNVVLEGEYVYSDLHSRDEATLTLYSAEVLDADSLYYVELKPYLGTVDKDASSLNIDYKETNTGTLSEDEILELLSNYDREDQLKSIVITNESTENNVVSKKVADAAIELVAGNADAKVSFRFEEDNGTMQEWSLCDLDQAYKQIADQTVNGKLNIDYDNEASVVSAVFESQELVAGRVAFAMIYPNVVASENCLNGIFPTNCEIETYYAETSGRIVVEDDTYSLILDDINALEADRNYTIIEKTYRGEEEIRTEDNGYSYRILTLNPAGIGATSFDRESLVHALSFRTSESYDEIIYVTRSADMTAEIPENIMSTLVNYLKVATTDHSVYLRLRVENPETGSGVDWIIVNPESNEEKQTLSASFAEEEYKAVLTLGGCALTGDSVNFTVFKNKENDGDAVESLKKLFVKPGTKLEVLDTELEGYFTEDDEYVYVELFDIGNFDAEKTLEIIPAQYKGNITITGGEFKTLTISYDEADAEVLTEEQLGRILSFYDKDDNLDNITICQPMTDESVIYKSVADSAAKLVANSRLAQLVFEFKDEETGRIQQWRLDEVDETTVQTGDQYVSALLHVQTKTYEEDFVEFSLDKKELVANRLSLTFIFNRNNENEEEDDALIEILGEKGIRLTTYNQEINGYYSIDEFRVCIELENILSIMDNTLYGIEPWVYIGITETVNEGEATVETLYLDAANLTKEVFDEDELINAALYYKERNYIFDRITIKQEQTGNNFISEYAVNELRTILAENDNSMLVYIFADDEESETTWEFRNVYELNQDLDVNLEWESTEDGLKVKFPESPLDVAENINLSIRVTEESDFYKNVLNPALGEPLYEGEEQNGHYIFLTADGFSYVDRTGAFYTRNPENDVITLYSVCLQECNLYSELLVLPCEYTDILLPYEQPVDLPELDEGWDEVIWTPLNIDAFSIENLKLVARKLNKECYLRVDYTDKNTDTAYFRIFRMYTTTGDSVKAPELPVIHAMPGVDATLADIDLNERVFDGDTTNGSFAWVNPETSLDEYADFEYHYFDAVYTAPDGKTANVSVRLDMVSVEKIVFHVGVADGDDYVFYPLGSATLQTGDELVLGGVVQLNCYSEEYIDSDAVKTVWSSKETLTPATDISSGYVENIQKYVATGKGKKTFTLSVVNAKTNKVLKSATVTIDVYEKELFWFDNAVFGYTDTQNSEDSMKGTLTFTIERNNYNAAKKLSFKSNDTAVLKLEKAKVTVPESSDEPVVITVDYTFKKYGKTFVTVAAADEKKSAKNIAMERVNYAPVIKETTVTVNKAWTTYEGAYTTLDILYHDDTVPVDSYIVTGKNASDFLVRNQTVVLTNKNLKNGTYKLKLEIPYLLLESGETLKETIEIKVKVINKAPKITVKQTQKLNEFYNTNYMQRDGAGRIVIDTDGYELIGFNPWGDTSAIQFHEVWAAGDYVYDLTCSREEDKLLTKDQKKYELVCTIWSDYGSYTKVIDFNVKTENKKPKLTVEVNPVFNTFLGELEADLTVMENGNEAIDLTQCRIEVMDGNRAVSIKSDEAVKLKVGKNHYFFDDNRGVSIRLDGSTAVKATDKITFRISKSEYTSAIDVACNVKVDTATPKIQLRQPTVTLNANKDFYRYAYFLNTVQVKGAEEVIDYTPDTVEIKAKDTKSENALANGLRVYGAGIRNVYTLLDKPVATGTYKFEVIHKVGDVSLSAPLTVKVVDKAPAKCLKVTTKGKLDVLKRESSYITMSPKITGLNGFVTDFYLKGADAELFEAYMDETGECIVQLKSEYVDEEQVYKYRTKHTYKVTPVYVVAAWERGPEYLLEGAQQKIKPVQSKTKVVVESDGNVLYANMGEKLALDFYAFAGAEEVLIKEVSLANYTNDLIWSGEMLYARESGKQLLKASGTYALKFNVSYVDGDGTLKDTVVTYKVKVIR
ncbi:MAG: hypothetical protein IJ291_03485 [Lachnospiraceae bacterium]|nr:hypothetical protein [Lachnospiraceae bacterium]